MVITKKYLKRLILVICNRLSFNKSIIEILEIEMTGTWVSALMETRFCMNDQQYHQILIDTFLEYIKKEHIIIG